MRAPRFMHQHKFDLAADALLISSGLFALAGSAVLIIVWLFGGFQDGSTANGPDLISDSWLAAALSVLATLVGVVGGPALAWRLHGYRLHPRLIIATLATPISILVVGLLAPVLSGVFQWLLTPFTDWEFAGAVALLVVVSIPYGIVLLHAARDAMAPAGDPPMLERMRLLSLTALLVLLFVVAGAIAIDRAEVAEALIFTMGIGLGAISTTIAAAYLELEHPADHTS